MLRAILSATVFNLKRARRLSHFLWFAILTLFPPALAALVKSQDDEFAKEPIVCLIFLYLTVVRLSAPLALLLWATPAVHNELEQGTWPFVAIRPNGRIGVFGGGYLSAVIWSLACGLGALALTLAVVQPPNLGLVALITAELVVWGALAYGAVYSLLGVLFLKRGMAAAVVYTLVVEVALMGVPAVVNQITVDYRLRTIAFNRLIGTPLEVDLPKTPIEFIGNSPTLQIVVLIGYTVGMLLLGAYILHRRELVLAER